LVSSVVAALGLPDAAATLLCAYGVLFHADGLAAVAFCDTTVLRRRSMVGNRILAKEPSKLMAEKILRWIRTLHTWAGVTLALLLILSSVTGSMLVWKQDYVKLIIPQAQLHFDPTPEKLATIAESIEAGFDTNDILQIQFATTDFPLSKIFLHDANYAYMDVQGQVVERWHQNERVEEWLYDLHHRLLLDDIGLTLVGLAALALIILVMAGLVAFIPLRRGFRSGIWLKSLARPHLLVSHRNVGLILALPLLSTLLTGLTLAFPDQAERLLLEETRSSQEYSDQLGLNLDDISGGDSGDWLPAMQRALAAFPGGEILTAQVPNGFNSYRIIGIRQPGEWNPNGLSRVYIDAELGYMDIRIDALSLPLVESAYNAGYPLHTGKTSSLPYKLFLTLVGMLTAVLATLGLVSFINGRQLRFSAHEQKRKASRVHTPAPY
jgi:uncharacterized iron-regulated membrane protein